MITPKQAREKNNADDADIVARVEAKIDKELAGYYGEPLDVDFGGGTVILPRVLAKILAMYRVHWDVVVKYGDQRDTGMILTFTERVRHSCACGAPSCDNCHG